MEEGNFTLWNQTTVKRLNSLLINDLENIVTLRCLLRNTLCLLKLFHNIQIFNGVWESSLPVCHNLNKKLRITVTIRLFGNTLIKNLSMPVNLVLKHFYIKHTNVSGGHKVEFQWISVRRISKKKKLWTENNKMAFCLTWSSWDYPAC